MQYIFVYTSPGFRIWKQYFGLFSQSILPFCWTEPNHFCLPTRNYCCLFVYYFHMHNYWYNFNLIAIKFLRNLRCTTQPTKSVRTNFEYILRVFFFVEGGSFIFRVSEDEVPQINMFERLPSARPLVFVNSCSNCFCLLLEDKLCRIYLWDPQANGLIRGKGICYGFRWGRGKFPLIKVEALNKLSIIKSFRHFKWASPKC